MLNLVAWIVAGSLGLLIVLAVLLIVGVLRRLQQLRMRLETQLPEWLAKYLPLDVHAVVGFTAQHSLKVTCIGPRTPEELYALERDLEPHIRAGIAALSAHTVSVTLSNPRVIRDHDQPS